MTDNVRAQKTTRVNVVKEGDNSHERFPGNTQDLLFADGATFDAFIEVDLLPLAEDAVEGTFYITPDGIVYYVQDGEWQTVNSLPEESITPQDVDDIWGSI